MGTTLFLFWTRTNSMWKYVNRHQIKVWGGLLLLEVLVEIACTAAIPDIRRYLYDGLASHNGHLLTYSLIFLGIAAIGLAVTQGFKAYLVRRTGLIVREGLVKDLFVKYTKAKDKDCISNPCGRISEDSRIVTEKLLSVFSELVISLGIAIILIISMIRMPLILGLALMYSLCSVLAALYFRSPLIDRKNTLQDAEGFYRRSITAISKGHEDGKPKTLFQQLKVKYLHYTSTLMHYTLYSSVQNQIAAILPLVLLTPMYMASKISLGDLMQMVTAFDLLVVNLTVPVVLYSQITEAQASWIRLRVFKERLNNE